MAIRTIAHVLGDGDVMALTDCFSNWKCRHIGDGWYRVTFEHHSEDEVREMMRTLRTFGTVRTVGKPS